MTNDIIVKNDTLPTTIKPDVLRNTAHAYSPTYNEERAGKLMDEIIASVKDDRTNIKRAISADIASTARVQNQNERVIAACERELRRRDLFNEEREKLLDRMNQAAKSTAYTNSESREFQRQQLDHFHKLPWRIIATIAILAVGGISGTALLRAAT